MTTKAQTHQINISTEDNWETPVLPLKEAMIKYNITPVIDVCATAENTKFPKFFTPEQNGLTQEIKEDFFMNCPYSEIEEWMEWAYTQHVKNNVNGLVLVFAKTSVKWWHKFVEGKAEVHFQKGRIRFLLDGIEPRYCKHCKTRFVEEIDCCKTCKHCSNCKKVFRNGLDNCVICNNKMEYQKIGKSSPTYDSAWLVFRKMEMKK